MWMPGWMTSVVVVSQGLLVSAPVKSSPITQAVFVTDVSSAAVTTCVQVKVQLWPAGSRSEAGSTPEGGVAVVCDLDRVVERVAQVRDGRVRGCRVRAVDCHELLDRDVRMDDVDH